jgi:hypothetical protein
MVKRKIYGAPEVKGKEKLIPLRHIMVDSEDPGYVNRVLVCTPAGTGSVRMEWVLARYGQVIPMNWSMVQYVQFMNSFVTYRYALPDAQNLIVQEAIKGEYEWLILIEDDNVLPPDAFMKWNKYMQERTVPVVSGLYFSKSNPSEPLIFRGRGTSVYWDWKFGDKVWCDGVPTGSLLIHMSILKAMYEESPTYVIPGMGQARRVFDMPQKVWTDGQGHFNTLVGTTDLQWCTRVMKDGIFKKAGWPEYSRKKYPFLVDTSLFVKHIDRNTGEQFPPEGALI